MKKVLHLTILLILAISIMALAGCTGTGKDVVSGTGTVKFIDLEGGFYGISGDDGKNYDPVNMSKEFQEDGLQIQFEAKIRTDVATTRMWGTPVEITKIELCKT
jgi:hypothetical protein